MQKSDKNIHEVKRIIIHIFLFDFRIRFFIKFNFTINWGRSCNNRLPAQKTGKELSARWSHALKSEVKISSDKKYWSIGFEKWILVYFYAFFHQADSFCEKKKPRNFVIRKSMCFNTQLAVQNSFFNLFTQISFTFIGEALAKTTVWKN